MCCRIKDYEKTMLLIMFAASTMAAFAQVSSSEQTIKPTLDISTNGMSLTKNSEEMPLLTVYDEEVIEKDKTPTIDINQHQFSTKNLAAIIGVKPKQVKAYHIFKGTDATRIWGYRGAKGGYWKFYLLPNIVN